MMMTNAAHERTREATVQLPTKGGQGVLVPGDFVLTAGSLVIDHAGELVGVDAMG